MFHQKPMLHSSDSKGAAEEKTTKWYLTVFKMSPLKVGLIIVMMCAAALVLHHRTATHTATRADFIGTLERALYDLRLKLRKPLPVSGMVGVLGIDERSLAKFGRWPFSRTAYQQAFENLKKHGVRWIGFDVSFAEPERRTIEESIDDLSSIFQKNTAQKIPNTENFQKEISALSENSLGDLMLGDSIQKFQTTVTTPASGDTPEITEVKGGIVRGYFLFSNTRMMEGLDLDWGTNFAGIAANSIDMVKLPSGQTLKDYPDLLQYGPLTDIPVIASASPFAGFLNNSPDADGVTRQATLIRAIHPLTPDKEPAGPAILVPSMAFSLALNAMGLTPVVKFSDDGMSGITDIQLLDEKDPSRAIDIPVQGDGDGRMLINFLYKTGAFTTVSLADAFEDKLEGKIPPVLIMGGTATGIDDIKPSPVDEVAQGVYHHAETIENIVSAAFMKRPGWAVWAELATLIVSGIFFSLVLKYASAVKSALVFAVMLLSVFFLDRYFLFGKGYFFYIGTFFVQSVSIFLAVTVFKYFTEEREKRQIRTAFAHYLHPAVINNLMDDPSQLKLGGDKKEMTVFFSDVRGFTTISEALTPEALANLLNEYFTPMTEIILNSNGFLDKYIGDAIMACWGAPISIPDHADRAVQSSLLMLNSLDLLRERWKEKNLPMMDIGIGLNSGSMIVGNMGGDQRFNYTVMGDAVNLGSRLEGVTKQYHVKIIISEFTHAMILRPQDFVFRNLDLIRVKGKLKPVGIYEVVRFTEKNRPAWEELVQTFEEAFKLYKKQEWDQATDLLLKIRQMNPSDGPTLEFLDRCKYFAENPPGADWDGVWVMKTK